MAPLLQSICVALLLCSAEASSSLSGKQSSSSSKKVVSSTPVASSSASIHSSPYHSASSTGSLATSSHGILSRSTSRPASVSKPPVTVVSPTSASRALTSISGLKSSASLSKPSVPTRSPLTSVRSASSGSIGSASKASAISKAPGASCDPRQDSAIYSAIEPYIFASLYCVEAYPESTYSIEYHQLDTTTTKTLTTTSTTCTVGTGSSLPAARSGFSTTSRSQPGTLVSSARAGSSASSIAKSASKAIVKSAASTTPLTQAPSSTLQASDAYSTFIGLPSDCISTICSQLAGTRTVTYTQSFTASSILFTSYVPTPEACAPLDFCDTNSTKPVCRPRPPINSCMPSNDFRLLPYCNSTNGCQGNCYHIPVPPSESSNPYDYDAHPDAYYVGVCVEGSPYVFTPNQNILRSCQQASDCGRGELCGVTKFGGACLTGASETCSNDAAPSKMFRRLRRSF